ncbi:MAG: hypothetical protein GF364_01240 [Candidatus Lokiarchaeota archaeon]|nr:hypothetical protein [Candidatus Lokiarchaeota archaeon]
MNEKAENEQTNPKWIPLVKDEDILINSVCFKCDKLLKPKEVKILLVNNGIKIFCEDCADALNIDVESAKLFDLREFERKTLCKTIDTKKITKFIHGFDLYLSFAIKIKNYRDQIEFCNF